MRILVHKLQLLFPWYGRQAPSEGIQDLRTIRNSTCAHVPKTLFATGFALRLGSAPTSVVAAGQLSEQAARRDPSIVKELCDTLDQMNAPDEGTHESLHCTQCCIGATTNYSVS